MASQGLAQVLAFATGILIVRSLDKTVYGQYGIVISTIAMLTFLSDSGTTSVLVSKGSKFLADVGLLSKLYFSGVRYRRLIGWPIAMLGCLALFFILVAGQTPVMEAGLLSLTALATFFPILAAGTAQPFLRLWSKVGTIEATIIIVGLIRLLGCLVIVSTGHGSVLGFLVLNLVCTSISAIVYTRTVQKNLNPIAKQYYFTQDFKQATRLTMPMVALIVGGEQLYLALIAHRASPALVGEALALSRFAVAFVVVNAVVTDIGAPWLARASGRVRDLRRRITVLLGAYTAASACIVGVVAATSPWLLQLLGNQYAGLEWPMVGFAASYSLFYIGLSWDSINQARGWLSYSWLYIPFLCIWFSLSWLIPMSSIWGLVVMFGSLSIPMIATQLARSWRGLRGTGSIPGETRMYA